MPSGQPSDGQLRRVPGLRQGLPGPLQAQRLSRVSDVENSWVDVDWSLNWPPTEDQRKQSLQQLKFRPVPIVAEPVTHLVDTFRTLLTNGGAHVAAFDVAQADDVAAWFISRNRDEYQLADRLVRSAAFAEALPDVATPGLTRVTGFERGSSLILDGELARSLQWGGAYTNPPMSGARAKAMGSAFCDSLFGDRYDEIDVDHSGARWSYWFKGIAWDSTWVITDKRHRHLTVLGITDTD